MKKTNFSKKLSVALLSAVTALSLTVTGLLGYTANASYDYSSPEKVKNEAYLESLFNAKSDDAKIIANYNAPSYYGLKNKVNENGVLVNFLKKGATVTLNKTYKVNELYEIIEFTPIVEQGLFGQSQTINEFEVTVYEEKQNNGVNYVANSVTYRFSKSMLDYQTATALTVAGYSSDGVNENAQTLGSYVCLDSSTWQYWVDPSEKNPQGVPNLLWKIPYMRRYVAGKRPFAVVGQTFGGKRGADPIRIGYEESGSGADKKVLALAKSYDKKVNELYDANEQYGLVRQLNVASTLPTGFTGTEDDFKAESTYIGLLDDVLFNGFSQNADLKIKLTNVEGEGKILINEIAGENLSSSIRINNDIKFYQGQQFNIPAPSYYENGLSSTKTANFKYAVYDNTKTGSDKTIVQLTNYTQSSVLTINSVGDFELYFETEVDGNYYSNSYTITVVNANNFDVDKVNLQTTVDFNKIPNFNKTKGNVINLGASSISNVYLQPTNVPITLIVKLNGALIETVNNLPANYDYVLQDSGVYTFEYTTTDAYYTCAKSYEISVSSCYYELSVPTETDWAFGEQSTKPFINKNVVIFSDYDFGRNFFDNQQADVNLTLSVKTPNSNNYVPLTTELENGYDFTEFGKYEFRYSLEYKSLTNETVKIPADAEYIEFSVNVVDAIAPVISLISGSEISGAVEVDRNNVIVTYNAEKGSEINFGKFIAIDEVGYEFNLSSKIVMNLNLEKADGSTVKLDATNSLNEGKYLLNELGVYYFNIEVSDGYNVSYLVLKVNTFKKLYTISNNTKFKTEYGTNVNITDDLFKVYDKYGVEVTNTTKKYAIYYNGEFVSEYDTLNYNPNKSGNYEIKLRCYDQSDLVAEKSYSFTVIDKTAPVITVYGDVKFKGFIGERLPIALMLSSDNQDATGDIYNEIKIYDANGNEMNYFNSTFTAIEEGIYNVVYKSTDLNGNVAEYSYQIEIIKEVEDTTIKVFGVELVWVIFAGVGIIALVLALTIFLVNNKKSKSNQSLEEEIE